MMEVHNHKQRENSYCETEDYNRDVEVIHCRVVWPGCGRPGCGTGTITSVRHQVVVCFVAGEVGHPEETKLS